MNPLNKINKTALFFKIMLLHVIVYYYAYGNIYNYISITYMNWSLFEKESLYRAFLAPLFGVTGWLDGIPFFFIIPFAIMLITINFFKKKWFVTYTFSMIVSYFFIYIIDSYPYHWFNDRLEKYPIDDINKLYFIVPSLLISVGVNWLVFRKSYKKIIRKYDPVK